MRVYSFSVSFEKTNRIMALFCVYWHAQKNHIIFLWVLEYFCRNFWNAVYRETRTEKFITYRSIRVSSSEMMLLHAVSQNTSGIFPSNWRVKPRQMRTGGVKLVPPWVDGHTKFRIPPTLTTRDHNYWCVWLLMNIIIKSNNWNGPPVITCNCWATDHK